MEQNPFKFNVKCNFVTQQEFHLLVPLNLILTETVSNMDYRLIVFLFTYYPYGT